MSHRKDKKSAWEASVYSEIKAAARFKEKIEPLLFKSGAVSRSEAERELQEMAKNAV